MDFTQITGDGTEKIITIIVALIVFFWIISIIWTVKDISARSDNFLLQIISVLFVTVLSPIIGLPLYLAIRPVCYKQDKKPRRDACLANNSLCQNCGTLNPKEYKCCIKCGEKLKVKCKECGEEYPHNYHYCNVCGAPNIEQK